MTRCATCAPSTTPRMKSPSCGFRARRHLVMSQRHADDRDVVVAEGQKVIEVDSQMTTGERADPEMHDTRAGAVAVVARSIRVRRVERGVSEPRLQHRPGRD